MGPNELLMSLQLWTTMGPNELLMYRNIKQLESLGNNIFHYNS